ncbi:hypothetical protein LB503_011164 [Fusarium chuoi]|nr:hypothetical protein LB503_011164 [Fusarium chuoi]
MQLKSESDSLSTPLTHPELYSTTETQWTSRNPHKRLHVLYRKKGTRYCKMPSTHFGPFSHPSSLPSSTVSNLYRKQMLSPAAYFLSFRQCTALRLSSIRSSHQTLPLQPLFGEV